jgi:hypothetical protein
MVINLYAVRIPVIFYNYSNMAPLHSGLLYTYDNALLIIDFGVVVIGCCAMYWSLAFMVFRSEFTASPGNYNAIHDPTIWTVAMSTQIEGSLDILSCTSLLSLASAGLLPSTQGVIVLFSLLEIVNACQSFGLQTVLSGGYDDTPVDLVRWKSYLRFYRGFIDFGAFFLRVYLWAYYDAVSSVFLIKNLYNLIHTISQVERSYRVIKYPKTTLFTEFVHPSEWYDMSREEWRQATSGSLVAQIRAGRGV